MIGKTFGHYEITNQLGKGGMGEVYQARDQKLGRDVAIKLLPEEFAKDADRVARFQREAKLLASLDHPNIAGIYGLEESGGTNFLVLELVEGETLADRIKQGPIPVEESLKLALQIAEALEAAHEKGVIHRDLKPANIKVTTDGKVKVLDFGLAKAHAGEQEVNLSNSPTLSNAATQQGLILGTAAYMSPEQARGKAVDKKADVWAFGCVLYEMLTGRVAFQGEDVSEILASVIKGDVKLDLLPANIHPRVRELIGRCLQRDLRRRYHDIADARYEIEQVLSDPGGVWTQTLAGSEPQPGRRPGLLWVAAAVVLTAIITGVAAWILKPNPLPEPRPVTRLYYELPKDQQFGELFERVLAISPDGRLLVYRTRAGLYLRSMSELNARLIPGTAGAFNPFFSHDSKWVGYLSRPENQLKKIAVSGGAPVALTDVSSLGWFSWGADDTIVYFQSGKGIMRVSANGGTPEIIVNNEKDLIISPQILPDGNSILFTELKSNQTKIMLQSLKSGERKELFGGVHAQYLPTGHIVYVVGNSLFAVSFDLDKLRVTGGRVSLVESILRSGGAPQYAVSDSGTLGYITGTVGTAEGIAVKTLVWVDRNGKERPVPAKPDSYVDPQISPDGKRLALAIYRGGNQSDIWIWDFVRENMTRLTMEPAENAYALWAPDGRRIAFASDREGNHRLYWKAADGTGREELLGIPQGSELSPSSWSHDGMVLLSAGTASAAPVSSNRGYDIGALSMEGDHKWKPLLNEKYNETQPRISPDGRWMAYVSDESGQYEVYVRPFPEVNAGKSKVSTSGGESPLWSRDGRELFYLNGDAVMAVSVKTQPTFSPASPATLFRGAYVTFAGSLDQLEPNPWDVSSDGKQFLMMKQTSSEQSAARINIVVNWLEELKQRVPAK